MINPKKLNRIVKQKSVKIATKPPIIIKPKPRVKTQKLSTHIPTPKNTDAGGKMKIAIVQTGSWGDNINSTLMLKPIKAKYPDCVLDVHTSSFYGSAFHNNPYIDNLIEYPADSKNDAIHLTLLIPDMIKTHNYELVFAPHPMYNHGNWSSIVNPHIGVNLICAWIRALEHADIKYDMPLETVLRLTSEEIAKVDHYLSFVPNLKQRRNILMEVHGESGQSFWDPEWTMKVCAYLMDGNTNIFFSRKNDCHDVRELKKMGNDQVHFVGHLSLRECAHIFNQCQAFFSVSSGLSNACNTNWCKNDIKWVECINSPAVNSSPIRSSDKLFWYQNDKDAFISKLKEIGL